MLKKFSFVFIFTLESTASSRCWAVVSVEYFFAYLLSTMNFECRPPELLLSASEGIFQKSFYFFLALLSKYFNGLYFDLAEATRCSLNFLPNKFLSCRVSKSASSLNISLDLRRGVEGCQNVIPSEICDIVIGLVQQEHCFLNICSHVQIFLVLLIF